MGDWLLCEGESIEPARHTLEGGGDKLRLPQDLVAGRAFATNTEGEEIDGVDVPDGWMASTSAGCFLRGYAGTDPRTRHGVLELADGAFELEPFAAGTPPGRRGDGGVRGTTVVGGGEPPPRSPEFAWPTA